MTTAAHATGAPRHWEPGSKALKQAARDVLASRAIQWTDLRESVFDALASGGQPASAYDVADRVSAITGRRIAANSVYRILDLFVGANLAKRVESRNAYVLNVHPNCTHDCIFLICQACGRIDHMDDDSLADRMRRQASAAGFTPGRAVLELQGRCTACSAASPTRA